MDRLERFYGPLPMPPSDPFTFYVWDVLGVRTARTRRDAATPRWPRCGGFRR
jgi:hypothetical protein